MNKLIFFLLIICSLFIEKNYKIVLPDADKCAFQEDSCLWAAYELYNSFGYNDIPMKSGFERTLIFIDYQKRDSLIEIELIASIFLEDIITQKPIAYFQDSIRNNIVYISTDEIALPADTIWQQQLLDKGMKILGDYLIYDWKKNEISEYNRTIENCSFLFDPIRILYVFKQGKLLKKSYITRIG